MTEAIHLLIFLKLHLFALTSNLLLFLLVYLSKLYTVRLCLLWVISVIAVMLRVSYTSCVMITGRNRYTKVSLYFPISSLQGLSYIIVQWVIRVAVPTQTLRTKLFNSGLNDIILERPIPLPYQQNLLWRARAESPINCNIEQWSIVLFCHEWQFNCRR